jgi:glycosyltransferase involved in cell wall biosynthesis
MQARATVIIPTYGNALFARWAIKSIQHQTVKNIEICIICDGSPENMVSLFENMQKEDTRIKVYKYPKSPRTGELYRDTVIGETTGKIICYCSHDDLWLPHHIEAVEKTLRKYWFTHSLHAIVNLPENIKDQETIFGAVHWINLKDRTIIEKMHGGQNFFGLTYGAHRRKCYYELKEGWVTTPRKDIPTDLYMWCKFLSAFEKHCGTTMKVTALNFQKVLRKDWSEQQRDDELKAYFERIQDPAFLRKINKLSLRFRPPSLLQKIKSRLYNKIKSFIKNNLSPLSQ